MYKNLELNTTMLMSDLKRRVSRLRVPVVWRPVDVRGIDRLEVTNAQVRSIVHDSCTQQIDNLLDAVDSEDIGEHDWASNSDLLWCKLLSDIVFRQHGN